MSELNSLSNRTKILLLLWSLFLAAGFFCWGVIYSRMNEGEEIITPSISQSEGICSSSLCISENFN